MTHRLKTISPYFERVKDGTKTFEIRRHDRDFQVGDTLELVHWDTTMGREGGGDVIRARVTHVFPGGAFGLERSWCILSFALESESVDADARISFVNCLFMPGQDEPSQAPQADGKKPDTVGEPSPPRANPESVQYPRTLAGVIAACDKMSWGYTVTKNDRVVPVVWHASVWTQGGGIHRSASSGIGVDEAVSEAFVAVDEAFNLNTSPYGWLLMKEAGQQAQPPKDQRDTAMRAAVEAAFRQIFWGSLAPGLSTCSLGTFRLYAHESGAWTAYIRDGLRWKLIGSGGEMPLDVETGGLDPTECALTHIAIVRFDPYETVDLGAAILQEVLKVRTEGKVKG